MKRSESLAAKPSAGLDLAGLSDLASMLETPAQPMEAPRMFDVDKLLDDPDNPRTADNPGFSDESIEELAATMRDERGVKTPLSLRPHPTRPGYFFINHGHRRKRAAIVNGFLQVPGFIDTKYDKFDQLIENIQREGLTARELADSIGSELAKGKTQAEIARILGKSRAFVSQHVELLDLPAPVADAFFTGRVQDVTLVNELVRAHKENPKAVEQALAEQGEGLAATPITRATVKTLRKPATKKAARDEKSGDVQRMEIALSDYLATPVTITPGKVGKHVQLIIHAHDWNYFNALLQRLGLEALIDVDLPQNP